MSAYLRLKDSSMLDHQGVGLEEYDCCMIMPDPTKQSWLEKVGKYEVCRARPSSILPSPRSM